MLCLVIKDCQDNKTDAMKKIHEALIGTPGYINNEIVLTEEPKGTDRFMIIIGNDNDKDITYEVSYHDLVQLTE